MRFFSRPLPFILLAAVYSAAQFAPKTFIAGGGIFLESQRQSGMSESHDYIITPDLGYSLNEHHVLGLAGTIVLGSASDALFVRPYWRYNFPYGERLGLFGLMGPYAGQSSYESDDYTSSTLEWGALGRAGAYWFPTDRVSLEMDFGDASFEWRRLKANNSVTTRTKRLHASLSASSVNFTLLYHFKGN